MPVGYWSRGKRDHWNYAIQKQPPTNRGRLQAAQQSMFVMIVLGGASEAFSLLRS